MIDNDVLDYDKFQGTGYADGHRLKYVARATYLLAHGDAMSRAADAAMESRDMEDTHGVEDYVSKKFASALKMEPHQMLGAGSRRGGNALALPASTAGSGTIGSYVFDGSKALVPYSAGGSGRRSRSLSRRKY